MKASDIPNHDQYEVVLTEDDGPRLLVGGKAIIMQSLVVEWDWNQDRSRGRWPHKVTVVLPGHIVKVPPAMKEMEGAP